MKSSEHRIVSLIPSGTEIVCALGYGDSIVGRSHACDYPASVQPAMVCSEPKIDLTGTSSQIDAAVRRAVADSLSVYRVFADRLQRLRPTLVITQTQCELCAVSRRDVVAAISASFDTEARLVTLRPMCVADIFADIMQIAISLDAVFEGRELVQTLRRRLNRLQESVPLRRCRVVCIEWLDPLMTGGNWIPELVEMAGGTPLLAEPGKHSPHITWEQLRAADPDVIVLMPCGFTIERTNQESHLLLEQLAWRELRAVRDAQVYVADGQQFFNRSGPRIVESAEILAEIFSRQSASPPHRGSGWRPFVHECTI